MSRTAIDESHLRPTGPLVDNSDLAGVAWHLLLALSELAHVNLLLQAHQWRWSWQGQVTNATAIGGTLTLHGDAMALQLDPARVIDVNKCGTEHCSGVRMYDESRMFLTLWSTDSLAFDAWLEKTLMKAC